MTYRERVSAPGPKRMLALDGGGLRGIISLEILARLERELRRHTGRSDLVLADVFDYIGGTSTGAIVAAGLSLGYEVGRLIELYMERGAEMFRRARLLRQLRYRYRHGSLERILKEEVGESTTFGSERLRTLLMVVLRNATTDSPWPLSNNPRAAFNDESLPDCNLRIPLWQVIRASTAAPVYFAPEKIRLGEAEFIFVDGGVTPFNNPALQLFVMATAPAFRLRWPTGADRLLLVSVGTGNTAHARPKLEPADMHLLYQATANVRALLLSSAIQQDLLCRLLGDCRHGPPIDLEVGDVRGEALLSEPLLSYVRYDVELTRPALDALDLGDVDLREVLPIDAVEHLGALQRVGRAVAEEQVDLAHMEGFLPAD